MSESPTPGESDVPGFDLDGAVSRAWVQFQRSLADHIAAMTAGDVLVLSPGYDDLADSIEADRTGLLLPCVQFMLLRDGIVRCEVPSNHFLHPQRTLTRVSERRLTELGWLPPTRTPHERPDDGSPAFFVDRPRTGSDRLAAMAVAALRDVWGVAHPSFLRAESTGQSPVPLTYSSTPPSVPELDPTAAVEPRDRAHLLDTVTAALVPVLGLLPERDRDGDIPIRIGSSVLFVRVLDSLDVQLFAPLVQQISDRTRSAEITADLNRAWSQVKFVLAEDRLSGYMDVRGEPFVPKHLVDAFDLFSAFLRSVDEDFAVRLRGRLYFGDHDDRTQVDPAAHRRRLSTGDLPVELLTLRDLDPEATGQLDGATVAAVCGGDHARILHVLRMGNEWIAQHRRDAGESTARGDEHEAAAYDALADTWERVVGSVRGALRLVGRHARGEHAADRPGLFGRPTASPPREDPQH
ncbi:hypothetical protein [Rhodococcus sp. HNM0569]|uniref:T3SS (YopN, CesT) and YbjN peptide-binding chaperone 1 n=1 Tax=Rhodococcus sp. HNM0569 TaxID=2716340 RepID=UPI00146CF39A|nr:hypothetical protein [Rhodococcus sp. HNM0569]NLU84401.1 hypothetical protein [Rhodococcus sp. HNM0569]